jgi:uncharacterized metal-binding protein
MFNYNNIQSRKKQSIFFMPSGKTHDRITLWGLPWVVGITFLVTRNGGLTLIVGGGFLFSGLMFGPDLDLYSIQFKRWGIFRWIWTPYQTLLSHRSQLSHGLIIGTILRIIYLVGVSLLIAIPGVGMAQLFLGFNWNWQHFAQRVFKWLTQEHRQEAIALFIGLESGAMSHSLSDWLGSTAKKLQKKRTPRKGISKK